MPNYSQVRARDTDAQRVPTWRLWLRGDDRRWTRAAAWAFWFGFFTLVLVVISRDYQRTHVRYAAWITVVGSAALVLFAIWQGGVAWSLSARYPIRRGRIAQSLGIHAIGALAVLVTGWVLGTVQQVTDVFLMSPPTKPFPVQVLEAAFWYAVLVALMHAVKYALDTRRSDDATLRLKAELSEAATQRMEAELRALKAQVSPRFLIEAFDTVSTLIQTAPAKAEESLAQIGDVVRSAFHRGSTREVTLREELEGLKPFLELERARLGGTLDVNIEKEGSVLDALVPDLILQPIVSTILNGHAAMGVTPRLAIVARRDRAGTDVLAVTIEGWGTQPASTEPPDFAGTANIQSRLAEMYGDAVRLELTERAGTNRKARLILPWQEVEREDALRGVPGVAEPGSPGWKSQWMRAAGMLAVAVAFWMLIVPMDVNFPMLRRVYESSLPRFYFEFSLLLNGLIFSLTVYAAIEMNRRLSLPGGAWSRRHKGLSHGGVALALGILNCLEKASLSIPAGILTDRSSRKMSFLIVGTIFMTVAVYALSAVVALVVTGAWRRIVAKRDALRLRVLMNETVRRRAEAELRALQAELNPHFLGNALHTVSSLVRTAPDDASRLLRELQTLLRFPMSRSGAHEVSLAEELETLAPYLAVERARMRRPLDVRWNVDQEALSGRVPRMILQPLLENAVQHGLAHQRNGGPGGIEVAARRLGGQLEVSVSDDGVGIDHDTGPVGRLGRPVGVANTRARLRELYGDSASFELASRASGGTVARILVPWHEEPTAPVTGVYTPPPAGELVYA